MKLLKSGEDYLETILILSKKGNVRAIDIVNKLNYSKPSVSIAMKKLKENGYIDIINSNIILTPIGYQIANNVYERHQIISKVLILLGVDEDIALKDACKIEHDLSNETFEAIKKYINNLK